MSIYICFVYSRLPLQFCESQLVNSKNITRFQKEVETCLLYRKPRKEYTIKLTQDGRHEKPPFFLAIGQTLFRLSVQLLMGQAIDRCPQLWTVTAWRTCTDVSPVGRSLSLSSLTTIVRKVLMKQKIITT